MVFTGSRRPKRTRTSEGHAAYTREVPNANQQNSESSSSEGDAKLYEDFRPPVGNQNNDNQVLLEPLRAE